VRVALLGTGVIKEFLNGYLYANTTGSKKRPTQVGVHVAACCAILFLGIFIHAHAIVRTLNICPCIFFNGNARERTSEPRGSNGHPPDRPSGCI
jgi:hypothetical protein